MKKQLIGIALLATLGAVALSGTAQAGGMLNGHTCNNRTLNSSSVNTTRFSESARIKPNTKQAGPKSTAKQRRFKVKSGRLLIVVE